MKKEKEKGMVLVMVVIFGAIGIMLGTALLSTSVLEVKSGNYYERDAGAYFIARSGAEIIEKAIVDGDITVSTAEQNFSGIIGSDSYSVTVKKEGTDKVVIHSVGDVKGVKDEVTLNLKEEIEGNSAFVPLDFAIFSNGSINTTQCTITGDIATNTIADNSVNVQQLILNSGKIYVGYGGNPDNVIKTVDWESRPPSGVLSETKTYPIPQIPDPPNISYIPSDNFIQKNQWDTNYTGLRYGSLLVNQDYTLDFTSGDLKNKDIKLEKLNIHGHTLKINVGNQDRSILVDDVITEWGDSNIVIQGEGKLNLYVTKTFNFLKAVEFNWNNDPKKFNIYYYGTDDVLLSGDRASSISATLYIKDAKINMPKCNFNGNILSASSKQILLGNDQPVILNGVVYAPKAELIVYKQTINGSVIVNKFVKNWDINIPINFRDTTTIEVPIGSGGGGGSGVSYERINFEK